MSLKTKTFRYWIHLYLYNNSFILHVKRNIKSHLFSNSVLLVCFPYILLNYWFSMFYEKAWGFRKVEKIMEKERSEIFKHEVAIVSISKNEGPYLIEWIEFHRMLGVTKFYFYDNESNDDTLDLLKPYIEAGIVDYTLQRGKAQQLVAYNDAIKKHKRECRWMAFLDMDEYLMPVDSSKGLGEVMNELVYKAKLGACGVGVNWAIFGTCGLKHKPEGLITENYTKRAENNYYLNIHIKTICNPRLVIDYISPHYPLYVKGGYSIREAWGNRIFGWGASDIVFRNLRINHYYTKSEEEYIAKRARGLGDRIGIYDDDHFKKYNKYDIEDYSMKPFISELRNRIVKYPNIR